MKVLNPHFVNFAMSTLPTWTIENRHNVKVNDGTQMTPCPCAWFKFAFFPFSTTHESNYVLLLAKVLDQPIHHFIVLCNKQISMGKLLTPIGPS
jgi:hypothetical protein